MHVRPLMAIAFVFFVTLILQGCGGASTESATAPSGPASPPPPSPSIPPPSPVDQVSPTIKITSPTSSVSFTASSASLSLGGTASDNISLKKVSWRNNATGASGNASGTANWTASNIALVDGANVIVVTAEDGAGNTATAALTVSFNASGPASLAGIIDSSRVDRNGGNAVYLYSGSVQPDDQGGATVEPIAVAPVTQDRGACGWSYRFDGIAAGTYTVAFTNQANIDNPATNDAITFVGTSIVTLTGGGATHDFDAARVLRVGPTRSFKKPSAAIATAQDGDVIEIDAGQYDNDFATFSQDGLTLRGVGGRAHLHGTTQIGNGKAIWVIKGADVRIENVEFSGATVVDENGAGIRAEGNGLTICNGYFHDNEDGILGGGGHLLIEYSEFAFNGLGDGQTHNIYVDGADRFTLRYSYSHHAKIGHNVKTRAPENFILYNRIMDEADGTASYAVDMPDCGASYLIGNLIQQGPNTDNSTMISYGAEGCNNPVRQLYVVNNTLVNDLGSGGFLFVRGGTTGKIMNNIFVGSGTIVSGQSGLLVSPNLLPPSTAGLVDRANYDYRLTAGSAARNAAVDPGSANGIDLVPRNQYVHKASMETRPVDAALDLGAYEYTP